MWTYACARVHTHTHVSVAMTEHREQRHLEEDRVHCRLQLSGHSPTLEEVRAGTQAGSEQRPRRVLADSHGLLAHPAFS